MIDLYWNPAAITFLAELVMATAVTAYFLMRLLKESKAKSKLSLRALLLFVSFAGVTLNVFFNVLRETLSLDQSVYILPLISPPMSFAAAAFVQFAYRFPSDNLFSKREQNLALLVCGLFVIAEFITAFIRFTFLADGFIEYRPKYLDLGFLVTGFWTMLIFARQLRHALLKDNANKAAIVRVLFFRRSISRPARAARAFLLFCMMPIALALVRYLHANGWLSHILSEILTSVLTLLFTAALALLYLNYIPERSSFMVKLVGVTLTSVLVVLGTMAWLISPIYADSYINPSIVSEGTAIRFEPDGRNGYSIARTAYRYNTNIGTKLKNTYNPVSLPFVFPFYGKKYEQIWPREDGFVGLKDWPWWRDLNMQAGPEPKLIPLAVELGGFKNDNMPENGGIFINSRPDLLQISWVNLPSTYIPDQIYTFQMTLYPKGVVVFTYKDLPDAFQNDMFNANQTPFSMGITPGHKNGPVKYQHYGTDLPISGTPNTGYIEHYRQDFLQYLNRIYMPIAWFMLGTSLFIILIFPMFFQVNLVRPLKNLIDGIRKFRTGDMDENLNVIYQDEIGYLTESFKDMAHAQSNLIDTLEDQVRERSAIAADLAADNARLEERNRISSDLHDAVSQTLFSSVILSETITNMKRYEPKRVKALLGDIRNLNQSALSEMRMLIMELRPQLIKDNSLGELLSQLSQTFETQNNIPVTTDITDQPELPEPIKMVFYRIAQESLNNISKHARSHSVSVVFDGTKSQALLIVEDDGVGFSEDGIPAGHWGLDIMKKRLKDIGGSLEIETTLDKGTRITALWMRDIDDEAQ